MRGKNARLFETRGVHSVCGGIDRGNFALIQSIFTRKNAGNFFIDFFIEQFTFEFINFLTDFFVLILF